MEARLFKAHLSIKMSALLPKKKKKSLPFQGKLRTKMIKRNANEYMVNNMQEVFNNLDQI